MKETSVLCMAIVMTLILNCICVSGSRNNQENDVQTPEVQTSKSVELEITYEETPCNLQTCDFDINVDYGLLMANAMANEDYSQAMLYEDIKNRKNEYLGIQDNLNYDDLFLLSKIVYAEAGSSWLTDEHRLLVASVVINRVHSPEFPDTLYDVIYQKGQYAPVEKAWFDDLLPSKSSVMAAYTVLTKGSIAPIDVVYQANFIQGSVYIDIPDDKLGTTYFCYSKNRNLYNK